MFKLCLKTPNMFCGRGQTPVSIACADLKDGLPSNPSPLTEARRMPVQRSSRIPPIGDGQGNWTEYRFVLRMGGPRTSVPSEAYRWWSRQCYWIRQNCG